MTAKSLLLAALIATSWIWACQAGGPAYLSTAPPPAYLDPGEPALMPPRFRTRCRFDVTYGRYYCAYRCGSDHQFYYCSRWSFGCCHIGVGYCDPAGLLRCRP